MKSVKLPIFVIPLVPISSFRNLPRCVIPLLPRFVIPEIYASISTPVVSIFYKPFYLQELPNKFENSSYFRVVLKNFKEIKWMKDISGLFISIFCKNYLINSIISSIFGWFFLHSKDLVNEGQILNVHKHFIYENFVMNFRISGFAGFAKWICNLDFIKVNKT